MDTNIRQKLFNYTEAPPASAWEGIAAALDETPAYAQKLRQFEAAPPKTAWNSIVAKIETPEAKVVPLRAKLFKYAIAAVVLGAIATASIRYLTNDGIAGFATQQQNTEENGGNKNAGSNTPVQTIITATQPERETAKTDPALPDETNTPGRALISFLPKVRMTKKPVAKEIVIKPEQRTVIDTETADRYMIATTAAGKAVRLPKKCYSDYACADAYINTYCKERLSTIQSKMAASVATDFTEFMDLLKKLQEGQ